MWKRRFHARAAAVRALVLVSGCAPLLVSAGYRDIRTQITTVELDFSYTMKGDASAQILLPGFDNTDAVVEGIDVRFDAWTDMSWQQWLYQSVPVGTRFASGGGSMTIGLGGMGIGLGDLSLQRAIALDCIPNNLGYCPAHTAYNGVSFPEYTFLSSRQTYDAGLIGNVLPLTASNVEYPSALGTYQGSYRTHGTLEISYTYDATPEWQHALQAYQTALPNYLATLGPGESFDQVKFSRLVYAEVIKLREMPSEVNGLKLSENQVIKRAEYTTRGISGALLSQVGFWRMGEDGDIVNDAANAYILLSAPMYVELKTIGGLIGVDYSERGGGKASIPRVDDVLSAYEGYLTNADSVESALNQIYDLQLSPVTSIPPRTQPRPDDRLSGVVVPLRLSDELPIVESRLFDFMVDDPASPVRLDPANTGRTLVVANGPGIGAVQVLDPEGQALAFTVEVGGQLFAVDAGLAFDFVGASFLEGVDGFFLSNIDPTVPEYDLKLWFTGTGLALVAAIDVSVLPAVPELPASWMLPVGLAAVAGMRRRRRLAAGRL